MKVRVSAPGKSILMGEHSVVYGKPALVAAVDRRLEVQFEPFKQDHVHLELPQVGVAETLSWAALQTYAEIAQDRWQDFARQPDQEKFRRLRGEDPAHLVKVALGEAGRFAEGGTPGLKLRLDSRIPIGSGFGSSAAVAVAVLRGFFAFCGRGLNDEQLSQLALEVERRQHGHPSGVDHATVIHGGVVWAWHDPVAGLCTEPLKVAPQRLAHLRVYHSGEPQEATGAVVAAVREKVAAEPRRFKSVLDKMEQTTLRLRQLLLQNDEDTDLFMELIRSFEWGLEELGVVPTSVRNLIREVEVLQGAAKISGAGALAGSAAGSLLVLPPAEAPEMEFAALRQIERLDVRLGAEGCRIESEEDD